MGKPRLPPVDAHIEVYARFFDAYPELIQREYLHNFFAIMPGGFYWTEYPLPQRKTLREHVITLAKKRGADPSQENEFRYNTKLRLGQTYAEFFAAIKGTIEECGLDCDEIEKTGMEITRLRVEGKNLSNEVKIKESLEEKIIPVYIGLREKGYNHLDLVR